MASFTRRDYAQAYLHIKQIEALNKRKKTASSERSIASRCYLLYNMIEDAIGQMDTEYALTIVNEIPAVRKPRGQGPRPLDIPVPSNPSDPEEF